MSIPVTNRRVLDVYFLREVAWSIHSQFLDPVDRAKTIPLSRITKIVNETWEGSDVVIPQDYVYRALLELQARTSYVSGGRPTIILTYNRPFLEVDSDTWYRTFDGLFGSYSNPPSLYYLDKQLKRRRQSTPCDTRPNGQKVPWQYQYGAEDTVGYG